MNQPAHKQIVSAHVLNPQILVEMKSLMGDAYHELIDAYVASTPIQIERLKEALVQGNADEIMLAAHQIKGSSGSIGTTQVARVAERIEIHSINGAIDKIQALVEELKAEYSYAEEALLAER